MLIFHFHSDCPFGAKTHIFVESHFKNRAILLLPIIHILKMLTNPVHIKYSKHKDCHITGKKYIKTESCHPTITLTARSTSECVHLCTERTDCLKASYSVDERLCYLTEVTTAVSSIAPRQNCWSKIVYD